MPNQRWVAFFILAVLYALVYWAKDGLAGWIALLNILLLGKVHVAWDKYLLPTIVTLWVLALFAHPKMQRSKALRRQPIIPFLPHEPINQK
ncbi:hypothetical protein [Tellurirhabdus bombi]|uniref:hypothetical protein n=1 Tax=Tellurirhabdus bombi TaxID=2907205 RepID=UPI001F407173|nr:hypothetical protein [Tellurirhabdus bombi]